MFSILFIMNNNFMQKFKQLYEEKCSKYGDMVPSVLPKVNRIIVIGDIHGDMDKLIECLKIAKLIDSRKNWIGGDTVVVQVGDQIDSCRYNNIDDCNDPNTYTPEKDTPYDMEILKFMTHLHSLALQQGGAVYSLMGNHELMNVQGDMSYVSHMNIKMFSNYRTSTGDIIHNGMDARKYVFQPGNEIAEFLACTRKVALIIGSNIFVHAGIIPYIANKYNIDDINIILGLFLFGEKINNNMFHELFLSGSKSPLWTRMYNSINKDNCDKVIGSLLKTYKVGHIYVGHTPQPEKGITSKCNNKIWMTDVGMSHSFDKIFEHSTGPLKRNAQVLEILDDGEIINILSL